jgi:hypothetical protein
MEVIKEAVCLIGGWKCYGRDLLGLDWWYSPLVLGLIRNKGCLLRYQVAWESSKPLYIGRGDVSI